jgi:hypothetical protein
MKLSSSKVAGEREHDVSAAPMFARLDVPEDDA